MRNHRKNRRWILAVLTAVVFPSLAFHGTCVAVLGPGTWGSGLQEVAPDFRKPTALALRYADGFRAAASEVPADLPPGNPIDGTVVRGRIIWKHRLGGRTAVLSEADGSGARPRRVYLAGRDGTRELALPEGHLAVRPQCVEGGVVYERWNPWAVPAVKKLRRYAASWIDTTLRPEASVYWADGEGGPWRYVMPGHSLSVAPDGRRAALLRSGALLAGYFSIHAWETGGDAAPAILSLREQGELGARSFSMQWSSDSQALRIFGRTDGYARRLPRDSIPAEGFSVDLLYLVADRTLYDLGTGA